MSIQINQPRTRDEILRGTSASTSTAVVQPPPVQSFKGFDVEVDKQRQQGKTDTDILNLIAKNSPTMAQKISIAKKKYGNAEFFGGHEINNDRDLINFLSSGYSGKLPKTPSVPVTPGIGKQILQTVAKPFILGAASGMAAGESMYQLAKGDKQAALEAATKPRSFGPLGTVENIGTDEQGRPLTEGQALKKGVGAGLEASSYLIPASVGKKILTTGGKLAVGGLAAGGAISGGMALGGAEMQNPESTLGSVAKQTAFGAATGAIAGPVFGKGLEAVGAGTKAISGGIKKASPLVGKYVNKAGELVDTLSSGRTSFSKPIDVSGLESQFVDAPTNRLLTSAIKPSKNNLGFEKDLPVVLDAIRDKADYIANSKTPMRAASEVINDTKKQVWNQVDEALQYATGQGAEINGNKAAAEIRSLMNNPKLQRESPEILAALEKKAKVYEGMLNPMETEDIIRTTNAELNSYYKSNMTNRAKTLLADPLKAADIKLAEALRAELDNVIDVVSKSDVRFKELKRVYGALTNVGNSLDDRIRVTEGSNITSLAEQISGMQTAGDVAGSILTGNFGSAASGAAKYGASKYIKFLESSDAKLARAFKRLKSGSKNLKFQPKPQPPKPKPLLLEAPKMRLGEATESMRKQRIAESKVLPQKEATKRLAELQGKQSPMIRDKKTGQMRKNPNYFDKSQLPNNGQYFGAIAGVEIDEEGNISFNPTKAVLGMAGTIGYSKLPKNIKITDLIKKGLSKGEAKAYIEDVASGVKALKEGNQSIEDISKYIKNRFDEVVVRPKIKDVKNLLVVHNLNERKLVFADKIGGLANPSTAVIDPRLTAFEGYGDISLIGNKDLISGEKTHLADAYTARFPSVHSSVSYKDFQRLSNDLEPLYKEIGTDAKKIYHDDTDMIRQIENNPAIALKFLKKEGITPSKEGEHYFHQQIEKNNLDSKFQAFLNDLYKEYNLKENLFAGYTNSGKRRYKPVTVEEASRIMKKQKDEGYNYGLGSYRSKIAPIKTSPEAIKKEAGKLVSKEDFEKIKDVHDKELWEIKEELSKYAKNKDYNSFIESDRQLEAIGGILKGEKDGMYYFNNKFESVPKELVDKIMKFKNRLKNMSTEYFETKFKRPVGINEFSAAVVPESISKEALSILEKKGLKIIKYKNGEKSATMKALLEHPEAFGIALTLGTGLGSIFKTNKKEEVQ